jgi:serine/threonine-protein kinase
MTELRPGTILEDYRIIKKLGEGGMAIVYLAEHVHLGSKHALKVLSSDILEYRRQRERFLDEGRIQATLNHPNIVRVTSTISQPGIAALVMDYVDGPTLASFIATHGRLHWQVAANTVIGLLHGVSRAHTAKVIHRDLKPSNVLLTLRPNAFPWPHVSDFGIAKHRANGREKTQTEARLGTSLYMSPEQVRDASRVDQRSDIWAIGAILHEMLGGRPAFDAPSEFDVMQRIVAGVPLELRSLRPDIPADLQLIVEWALRVDPRERPQDCDSMARAVEMVIANPARPIAQSPSQPRVQPHRQSPAHRVASPAPSARDARKSPGLSLLWRLFTWLMTGAGLLAIAWGLALLALTADAWNKMAYLLVAAVGIAWLSVVRGIGARQAKIVTGTAIAFGIYGLFAHRTSSSNPTVTVQPPAPTQAPVPLPPATPVQTALPPAPSPSLRAQAKKHNGAGLSALRARQYQKAAEQFKLATQKDGTFVEGWANLGLAELGLEHPAEARAAATRALNIPGGGELEARAKAHYVLGRVLHAERDFAGARRAYETALALPGDKQLVNQALSELDVQTAPRPVVTAVLSKLLSGTLLADGDLVPLTPAEITVLREAPYARHGRQFKSASLNTFYYGPTSIAKLRINPRYTRGALTPEDEGNLRFFELSQDSSRLAQ